MATGIRSANAPTLFMTVERTPPTDDNATTWTVGEEVAPRVEGWPGSIVEFEMDGQVSRYKITRNFVARRVE